MAVLPHLPGGRMPTTDSSRNTVNNLGDAGCLLKPTAVQISFQVQISTIYPSAVTSLDSYEIPDATRVRETLHDLIKGRQEKRPESQFGTSSFGPLTLDSSLMLNRRLTLFVD